MRQLSVYVKREEREGKCGESVGTGRLGGVVVERERERDRRSKRGREQHVLWRSFKSLVWGQPFSFCFVWLWPDSGPCPQDGLQHVGLWEVDRKYRGLVPLLSLTPEEPFCESVVPEVLLTPRMRNRRLSFFRAGCCFYLEVTCPQGTECSCSAWEPEYGLI